MFAEYDPGFQAEIVAHEPLREQITALQDLLSVMTSAEKVEESLPKIAEGFAHLRSQISAQYDIEEDLVCSLGKKVPIDRIRGMEKLQEERRKSDVKTYGHLWTAVYLLRGLNPKERAIFSPGIPKFVAGGMLTAGAMQFRR